MCGINGIFHFQKSNPVVGELEKMNKVLAHRGPDAEGVFRENEIELGHRRLSIIDVSEGANQPMTSSDGNLVIVFNGELYNYLDLKSQLPDYNYKTSSDTEVVLAAYQKWGEHALRAFNGIFSFAIWDKSKRELFIARDRVGVKPLYYYLTNDVFVFSSSLKSILSTNRSTRKISKSSLVDYLRYQTVHAPETIVEDVFVLMPGHTARVDEENGFQIKEYWSLTQASPKKFKSAEDVKLAVRNQVTKSVEMQLVADVPFGAFLSGGIDSSLLVAIMSQVRNQKTDTFSVVFKEDEFSEKKFAQLIAKKYQTNHHEIELSVTDFRDLIPEALSFMDHPSGDGPNTYVVSKKTHEAGIKMALSGLGGDELFGGYSIFNQLPELQQKKWLRSFPAYARRPFARLYGKAKGTIASTKIAALMSLEEFDIEDIYQYYRQVFMDEQIIKLIAYPSLTSNRVLEIVRDQVGYRRAGSPLPRLSKISIAEMSTYMQNVLLRDADQMSMANGLEVRVPFLDHDLIELAFGIDDVYKNPVSPKKILVESFSDLLPEEIYNRPKMGFVLPYEIWMKNELKSFCEERLNWLRDSGHFNSAELETIWKQFLSGNKLITWSRIWTLVVLANWMKENDVK
jgi:asparagine synthase (glutamine-hydrolysing)